MQQVSKWNVFWRSLASVGSLFQLCLLLLVHMESHSLNGGHRAYSSCGRCSPQRLGDFKERIFRQRNRGVRYAEVSCRSHACTADTIIDNGFWKCISELKVMPYEWGITWFCLNVTINLLCQHSFGHFLETGMS